LLSLGFRNPARRAALPQQFTGVASAVLHFTATPPVHAERKQT